MRKNPVVGSHPDLFGGETRVVRPATEMTRAQLIKLPRDAFSDDEWYDLDEDIREEIYERDPASKKRVENLVHEFVRRHKWLTEGDNDYLHDSLQEDIDQQIANMSNRDWAQAVERHAPRSWYANLAEELPGYSEAQIDEALVEVLQDNNVYEYAWNTSEYGSAFFKAMSSDSFYVERADLKEWLEEMHYDEIERAVDEINHDTYLSLTADQLLEAAEKHGLDIHDYVQVYADADPDWNSVHDRVLELLGEKEPEGGLEEHALPPEERILHTYKDGFFVLDLTPDELPAEGKNMGMCVGRSDMGYIKAVRQGTTKILSLRRPSGKPLFTLEAILDKKGNIVEIAQIKGKANRLPGWDLGQEGKGQLKVDEVKKAIELVEGLGVDPNEVGDLRPALLALQGQRRNPSYRPTYRTFDDPALGA